MQPVINEYVTGKDLAKHVENSAWPSQELVFKIYTIF